MTFPSGWRKVIDTNNQVVYKNKRTKRIIETRKEGETYFVITYFLHEAHGNSFSDCKLVANVPRKSDAVSLVYNLIRRKQI